MYKTSFKKIILPLTLLSLGASVLFLGKSVYSPKTWSTPKAAYQDYLYKRGLVSFLDKGKIIPAKSSKSVDCSTLDTSVDDKVKSISEFGNPRKKTKVRSLYLASKDSKNTLYISQHLLRDEVELSKKCYQIVLNIEQKLARVQ